MTFKKFEDILAWQKAQDIAKQLFVSLKLSKEFGFKDQITRSAISVSNNIAEGFERSSDADFKRFLFIAKGSCAETKSMLYLAESLLLLDGEACVQLRNQCDEVSRMLVSLIKSLSKQVPRGAGASVSSD